MTTTFRSQIVVTLLGFCLLLTGAFVLFGNAAHASALSCGDVRTGTVTCPTFLPTGANRCTTDSTGVWQCTGGTMPGDGKLYSSTGKDLGALGLAAGEKLASCQDMGLNPFKYIQCGVEVVVFITIPTAIISFFSLILDFAGYSFDATLDITVVNFASWYGYLQTAITQIWTLFRDIANIAIIGLFVFIAINIILGNQNYGEKKLIARVLVVAVLINFSFLFTSIAINFSNTVATGFYQTMLAPALAGNSAGAGAGSQASTPGSLGTALAFEELLKIRSLKDTTSMLVEITNRPGASAYLYVYWHTTVLIIFVLFTSIVLFYGGSLLLGRFLILILLLLVSSLAFASYLLPSLADSAVGFHAWLRALLKNALVAPIMIIFLWIALELGKAVVAIPGTSSLAGLSSGTFDATSIKGLISFILILGFLFAGMYIASMLSSGFASRMASASLGSWSAVAAGLTGLGLRNTLGKGALARLESMRANTVGKGITPNMLQRAFMGGLGTLSKASYNPLTNKGIAKAISSTGGFTFGAENAGKGGYVGVKERQAKDAVHRAEELVGTLTDEKKAATADAIREQYRTSADAAQADVETARSARSGIEGIIREAGTAAASAAQADYTARVPNIRATQEAAVANNENTIRSAERVKSEHESQLRVTEQEIARARGVSDARAASVAERDRAAALTGIETQNAILERARAELPANRAALENITSGRDMNAFVERARTEREAAVRASRQSELDKHAADLTEAQTALDTITAKREDKIAEIPHDFHKVVEKTAEKVAKTRLATLYGLAATDKDPVAAKVRGEFKKQTKKKRTETILEGLGVQAEQPTEHATPAADAAHPPDGAAPAAPAAAPPAH